ncbi:MAG: hypothetical protein AB1453_13575 [Chloroflexota bacterium]
MMDPLLQADVNQELARAENARLNQNEGMARVSARRAAGLVARAFLLARGGYPATLTVLDALNIIKSSPDMPYRVRKNAENLTLRINANFDLPVQVDLIAEAKALVEQLALLSGGKIDL